MGLVSTPEVVGTELGRYLLFDELASGGMSVIHLGVLSGAAGFARAVAIKRLHPHFARDPEFVAMLVDEARLASRIRHPNVVAPEDVVASDDELFLVMEYVLGATLAELLKAAKAAGTRVPKTIAVRAATDTLFGLHAAHEATDENGAALHIIHRDVSPDNILVGADGVARVVDFGIAKATVRLQSTRDGQLKGKLRYMPPEQLQDREVTAQADIYSASVVLWETLTARRLHAAKSEAGIVSKILHEAVPAPSQLVSSIPAQLDAVVLQGLAKDPTNRFASARDMAIALECAVTPASAREVADWMRALVGDELDRRAEKVRAIERSSARYVRGGVAPGAPGATPPPSGASPRVAPNAPLAARHVPTLSVHATADAPPPRPPPSPRGRPAGAGTATLEVGVVRPAAPNGVALGAPAPTRARSRRVLAGGLAALALLVLALAMQFVRDAPETPSTEAEPQPGAKSTAAATVATPAEAVAASPTAPNSAAPPPDSAASSASAAPSSKPRLAPTPKRPGRPKTANCDPPWIEDKGGFRQVKRECL